MLLRSVQEVSYLQGDKRLMRALEETLAKLYDPLKWDGFTPAPERLLEPYPGEKCPVHMEEINPGLIHEHAPPGAIPMLCIGVELFPHRAKRLLEIAQTCADTIWN
jgi:hypothetical protein